MPIRQFAADRLAVEVHARRDELGRAAAERAARILGETIAREGHAAMVFAAAASQNEFLAALRGDRSIAWPRVTAFHMDEYAGIAATHPASFRRFLRERLMDYVPLAAFHELRGDAADLAAEAARYAKLLAQTPPALAAMGIGENGHLAFIDPHECDFEDPCDVKLVLLDDRCRMQQVHDGAFERIEDVPRRALSLTVPFFLRTAHAVVCVPGRAKRAAVQAALEGPIAECCPASALRRHADAVLYLDCESAGIP